MEPVMRNNKVIKLTTNWILRVWETKEFVDCRFRVGTPPNECLICAHQLLLALRSPVFERMFFGDIPEKDPFNIRVLDIQPAVFELMMKYIYTAPQVVLSFNTTCELYYAAKKYMLSGLIKYCTDILLARLNPDTACRIYEFGKLHEDALLIRSGMEHIVYLTHYVIREPSFMDIEFSTLMTILDQSYLTISELDLFYTFLKYANARGILNDEGKDNISDAISEDLNDFVVLEEIEMDSDHSSSGSASASAGKCGNLSDDSFEVVDVNSSAFASGNAVELAAKTINTKDAQRTIIEEAKLKEAFKKIRFLAMTPYQFAQGPALCKFLKQSEAFAILLNISCPFIRNCPMPEGFSRLGERKRGRLFNLERLMQYPMENQHQYQRDATRREKKKNVLPFSQLGLEK